MTNSTIKNLAILGIATSMAACNTTLPTAKAIESKAVNGYKKAIEKSQEVLPVVSSTNEAWLAGAPVRVAEPVLPILNQEIVYHPTKAVSLSDVASWVTQSTGLVVDIGELQSPTITSAGVGGGAPLAPMASGSLGLQTLLSGLRINFDGTLSGLLDVAASKVNAWWKVEDGKVVFFRTETKTFYIPAVARKFTGNSTISSSSSNAGGSSGGTVSGASVVGGAENTSNFAVDLWTDLNTTIRAVAGNALIATNQSAGSITVTGTPGQVRRVETMIKDLSNQLSQQVAITVQVFVVKLNNEDNYNWDPTIIFTRASGGLNYALSGGAVPAVLSGKTPANLTVSQNSGQYSGSKAAFNALSTLGSVTQTINQTVVTLNGQPVPIQLSNNQGYLAASSTTTTANVGTTATLTPGTITTGFTAMFLPRIVNGKVILGMSITNSSNNGFTLISSGGSSIQNPNVDSNIFQQSVSLTPGDALLLTGLQRDDGTMNKSGVGSPNNFTLGGGVSNGANKQMTGIVVSAKIL